MRAIERSVLRPATSLRRSPTSLPHSEASASKADDVCTFHMYDPAELFMLERRSESAAPGRMEHDKLCLSSPSQTIQGSPEGGWSRSYHPSNGQPTDPGGTRYTPIGGVCYLEERERVGHRASRSMSVTVRAPFSKPRGLRTPMISPLTDPSATVPSNTREECC